MIKFTDDYTQIVFTKTLDHFHRVNKGKLSINGYRSFADYALTFLLLPSQTYTLNILPSDVDDEGIAREIGFARQELFEKVIDEDLRAISVSKYEPPYFYQFSLEGYEGGKLHGALVNHGTSTEPNWGSHT